MLVSIVSPIKRKAKGKLLVASHVVSLFKNVHRVKFYFLNICYNAKCRGFVLNLSGRSCLSLPYSISDYT